jgi:polyisoprenyl-teichoic acid--peptidoglycan teichoic acid transferase
MSGTEQPDQDTATETEQLPVLEPEEYPTVRRTEQQAVQRRRRRNVVIAVLSAALVVLAAGVVAIPLLDREGDGVTSAATAEPTAMAAGSVVDPTTLLLVSHPDEPDPGADSITLFAVDPASDRGAILFVPVDLLVELPGIGLERLGTAQHFEGVGLVSETVSEVLDIDVAASTAVGHEQLGRLLGAGGPLTVDVGAQPLTGQVGEDEEAVRFEAGEQTLDGAELVQYWTVVGQQEQVFADLTRRQQVVMGLLGRFEDDPDVLDDVLGSGGVELGATAEPAVVRGVLTELAAAHAADQLAFGALPVRPFGQTAADGSAVFALSEESQTILSSLLVGVGDEDATRVEVRDASGNRDLLSRVEAAHRVDEALGDDFRVSLGAVTEDEVAQTEVVIYADTPEARERAEAVRAALGLGTITVEEQPQTAVDMTIRLGDDFLAEAP